MGRASRFGEIPQKKHHPDAFHGLFRTRAGPSRRLCRAYGSESSPRSGSRSLRRVSSVRVSGEEAHESLCCPGSANAVRTAVQKKGVEFLSRCHGSCDGIITLPPPNPSFDSSTVTALQVQQRGVRFHGSREFTPSLWKESTCVRKSSEANLARGRRFGWTGFISSLRGRELFPWRAENPTGRLHGKSASSRTRSRARAHPPPRRTRLFDRLKIHTPVDFSSRNRHFTGPRVQTPFDSPNNPGVKEVHR